MRDFRPSRSHGVSYNAAVRLFVTATDTGVGKTQIAAALLSLMVERGARPFAFKPYESGVPGAVAQSDSERLRRAAGGWQTPGQVNVARYAAPLAPGLAGPPVHGPHPAWRTVLATARRLAPGDGVIEGAGGLFVPLDRQHDVIDLIEALGVPAVVVARAGLGTINHTSLTLNALEARGVVVAGVVLNASTPAQRAARDPSVELNRQELVRRFPRVPFVGPIEFAAARATRERLVKAALRPWFLKLVRRLG